MLNQVVDDKISLYSKGKLSSFSDLYDQYGSMVRAVLYKLCDAADIDDLVQDSFMRIYKGLPKFKQNSSLKTWIYRVAYNVAVDDLRKRKKPKPELEVEDTVASSASGTENRDLVHKNLKKLSEDHRTVLVLVCMEDLSLKEVAGITGVPVGTIKSRLHHAKNQMYAFLKSSGAKL